MKVQPEYFSSRDECSNTCKLFLELLGKDLATKYGIRHLRVDVEHDVHGYYQVDPNLVKTTGPSKIEPCYIHVQTYPGFSNQERGICLVAWRQKVPEDNVIKDEWLINQKFFPWDSEQKIADTLAEKLGFNPNLE